MVEKLEKLEEIYIMVNESKVKKFDGVGQLARSICGLKNLKKKKNVSYFEVNGEKYDMENIEYYFQNGEDLLYMD